MAETKLYLELQQKKKKKKKKKKNLKKGLVALATQDGPWEGSVLVNLFSIT